MKRFQQALLIGAGMALASSSAMAAFTFANGDMILGFQAASGVGSTKNVFFNLGSSTTLRDLNTDYPTQLGDISTTLESAFGTNWYSRSDVYFGVIGNLNTRAASGSGQTGPFFSAAVNGDPSRTVYLSQATNTPGGGFLYAPNTFDPTALALGGGNLTGLEAILPNLTTETDGAAILNQATKPVEWQNGWTAWNPTPGAGFEVFTGGIQQSLGKGTPETYVDVQRILSTTVGANPTGVVGGGAFEYTVAIGSNGSVSIVPEVSSTFLIGAIGLAAAFQRRRFQLA